MADVHAPSAAPGPFSSIASAAIDTILVALLAAAVLLIAPTPGWPWALGALLVAVALLVLWRGMLGGSVGHALLRLRSVDTLSGLPSFRFFTGRSSVRSGGTEDPFRLSPRPVSVAAPVHDAPRVEQSRAHLRLLVDDGTAHSIQHSAIVGRYPSAPPDPRYVLIAIPDLTRTISKSHFAVEVGEAGVTITDLRSANGTWVMGTEAPLVPLQPTTVPWGSTLLVGGRRFILERRRFLLERR